ncbi:hypothetical protein NHQ30_006610 [Ciborinia camelliae]|nr:hypothetical protein NHQ30_006610 [Ciborinia camelliae]
MPIVPVMADTKSPSPFMRIPPEVRVMIYKLLFDDKNNKVFEIRNQNPNAYANRANRPLRSSYGVDRSLMLQSVCTTYHLCTAVDIHTSIMSVNRQIYGESAHLLYENRIFSFYKDIEAVDPFFSDLTPGMRSDQIQLKSLKLIIEGGRPRLGWGNLTRYTSADFKTLSRVAFEPLEWAFQLLEIKGIQRLKITSEMHSIPPPSRSSMAFFSAFSASIENGFAEYLRRELIGA